MKSLALALIFQMFWSQPGLAAGPWNSSYGMQVLVGSGSMGNQDNVKDRKMIYFPAAVFATVDWRRLRLGLIGEYQYAGQTEKMTDFQKQNLSGSGFTPGIKFDYYDGTKSLGVIIRGTHRYELSQNSSADQKVIYEGTGGYGIQFSQKIGDSTGLVLDYAQETFTTSFDSKIKWSRAGIGIVFSNFRKRQ